MYTDVINIYPDITLDGSYQTCQTLVRIRYRPIGQHREFSCRGNARHHETAGGLTSELALQIDLLIRPVKRQVSCGRSAVRSLASPHAAWQPVLIMLMCAAARGKFRPKTCSTSS